MMRTLMLMMISAKDHCCYTLMRDKNGEIYKRHRAVPLDAMKS
jgi:hypothetical protein